MLRAALSVVFAMFAMGACNRPSPTPMSDPPRTNDSHAASSGASSGASSDTPSSSIAPKVAPPIARTITVMPLGDSITDGYATPGGYRVDLYEHARAAGVTVRFVGSQSNGPTSLPEHAHEGHSGWTIDELDAHVKGWLVATRPEVVLLLIGTNDVWGNLALPKAPARLAHLLDDVHDTAATARIFVASIPPIRGDAAEARVRAFNAAIPALIEARKSVGFRYVEMHDAMTTDDLADEAHPTPQGYAKMARVWWSALRAELAIP